MDMLILFEKLVSLGQDFELRLLYFCFFCDTKTRVSIRKVRDNLVKTFFT